RPDVAAALAGGLDGAARRRPRHAAELPADLFGCGHRSTDRLARDRTQIAADRGGRLDRPAHGRDAGHAQRGPDVLHADERGEDRVLHEIEDADGDDLAAVDRVFDGALGPLGVLLESRYG